MPVIIECTLPPIINIMSHITVKYPNKNETNTHFMQIHVYANFSMLITLYCK